MFRFEKGATARDRATRFWSSFLRRRHPTAHEVATFEDDYVLEGKELGNGSHGAVVAARCRHSGQRVAVKTVHLGGLDDKARRCLVREAHVAKRLDHPHIAKTVGVYETDAELKLVMERLHGGELFDRVTERGNLSDSDAAGVTYQIASALAYMHAQGVVHRDLKLDNFLFHSRQGSTLKLIDFGYSRFFEPGERMATRVGTPSYVAPEVLSRRYYSGSCDVWSLGVVTFAMLGGYLPFDRRNQRETLHAVRTGSYNMVPERWAGASPEAVDFIGRVLEPDASRRLTAVQALAHPWVAGAAPRGDSGEAAESLARAVASFAEASLHRQAVLRRLARRRALPEGRRLRELFALLDEAHRGTADLHVARRLLHRAPGAAALGDQLGFVALALRAEAVSGEGEGCSGDRVSYSDFLALMHSTGHDVDDEDELVRGAFDGLAADGNESVGYDSGEEDNPVTVFSAFDAFGGAEDAAVLSC